MKFYSEKLKKIFDTEEELIKAEKELEDKQAEELKKSQEKKERAHEIELAYTEYQKVKREALDTIKEAENKWLSLRDDFIKDFGSFHMSYCKDNDKEEVSVGDFIDKIMLPFKTWF